MRRLILSRLRAPQRGLSQAAAVAKTAEAKPKIVIPKAIPRGPTDILKAIASTVRTDPTGFDYVYIDDPFLLPVTLSSRREFALAKANGRKAARYFLKNYPKLFEYNPAQPNIPAFNAPDKFFTADGQYTVEDLQYCIDNLQIPDALIVYETLQKSEVPENIKLDLLELLCFFNGKEVPLDAFVEASWFNQPTASFLNSWDCPQAAEIFESLEDKNERAYSAMMAGYAKYNDCDSALRIYEEMREKGMTPTVQAYNHFLRCGVSMFEKRDGKLDFIINTLKEMSQLDVQPNIDTFHSCLRALRGAGSDGRAGKLVTELLNEMRAIGVAPSLGTYAHIIKMFMSPRNTKYDIINEILGMIEDETLKYRHPDDFEFFQTAMRHCARDSGDLNLARRVYELFEKNSKMLESNLGVVQIHSDYFTLLCSHGEVDEVMTLYMRLVPQKYIPELFMYNTLFKAVNESQKAHYIFPLWSDLTLARNHLRPEMRQAFLDACVSYRGNDQRILGRMAFLVEDLRKRVEENQSSADESHKRFTAQMVSCMIDIYFNAGLVDRAVEEMNRFLSNPTNCSGVPKEKTLLRYVSKTCEVGLIEDAKACAKYADSMGFSAVCDFMTVNAEKYKLDEEPEEAGVGL